MNVSQRREISQDLTAGVVRSSGSYELVFGAILFSVIGLGIDYLLGTLPLFLTIFAVFGFLATALSLYRQYQYRMNIVSAQRDERAGRSS